ncbi:hypothetical protein [Allorhodopirellula heiligendammensis]|uniref:Uncharacterized protein n=1 Tax=Allorhodopirellula heiligendammensis TaxID=2714739 RepID=A0A5C6C332_9BACT|nr:hypothetical protein [Allorhodopirellula heiligendammensis]TWU17916.1 hypothetical protein Poly21_00680 [Allorhodopirellula heiligendammensis]
MFRSSKIHGTTAAFVVDGRRRLLSGIDAEVRREIEQNNAEEWNASGLWQRWFLLRRMDRETAEGIAKRAADVSPNSLF